MDTEAAQPSARDDVWAQRWDLVCRVRLSSLYHEKRERFFDVADKLSKAFAVIGGAAAVSQLIADPTSKIWIAALVSIASTISLVFGIAQKARRHGELARDFKKLWARIEEVGNFPVEQQISKFRSEILLLESNEPAAMSALIRHCENQISLGTGHPDEVIPLTLTQLTLMHFWDFPLQPDKSRAHSP